MDPTSTHPSRTGPPRPLDVRVAFGDGDDATVLAVGELDVATGPTLDEVLEAVLAAGGRRIRLDARDLTFVDCRGFDVIDRHARTISDAGGELDIVEPSEALQRLLQLLGWPRRP